MKYEEIRKSIALKIKLLREGQKLSQDDLAKKAGVSQKTISNLENINATNDSCNLDKLTAVANALKTPLVHFLTEESNNTTELEPDTVEFAKAWQNLPPEQRGTLAAFVYACQKSTKKVA